MVTLLLLEARGVEVDLRLPASTPWQPIFPPGQVEEVPGGALRTPVYNSSLYAIGMGEGALLTCAWRCIACTKCFDQQWCISDACFCVQAGGSPAGLSSYTLSFICGGGDIIEHGKWRVENYCSLCPVLV